MFCVLCVFRMSRIKGFRKISKKKKLSVTSYKFSLFICLYPIIFLFCSSVYKKVYKLGQENCGKFTQFLKGSAKPYEKPTTCPTHAEMVFSRGSGGSPTVRCFWYERRSVQAYEEGAELTLSKIFRFPNIHK